MATIPARESCPGTHFRFAQDAENATLTTARAEGLVLSERRQYVYRSTSGRNTASRERGVHETYDSDLVNCDENLITSQIDSTPMPLKAFLTASASTRVACSTTVAATVQLAQDNTDVAIPFLVSSKGYAVMWNTASLTEVDKPAFRLRLSSPRSLLPPSITLLIYGLRWIRSSINIRTLTGHATHAAQVGLRVLSIERPLSIPARAPRHRPSLSRAAYPARCHRADWFWWRPKAYPVFNEKFNDVPAELKELHEETCARHDLHLGSFRCPRRTTSSS